VDEVQEVLTDAVNLLGLAHAGLLAQSGRLSYAATLLVFKKAQFLRMDLLALQTAVPNLHSLLIPASVIFQVLDVKPRIGLLEGTVPPPCAPSGRGGHIRFEGVRFTYPLRPGREVLRGLTLEARPREVFVTADTVSNKDILCVIIIIL
jgi:ABC-type multidrug transport system fused ATPase/permease subunit